MPNSPRAEGALSFATIGITGQGFSTGRRKASRTEGLAVPRLSEMLDGAASLDCNQLYGDFSMKTVTKLVMGAAVLTAAAGAAHAGTTLPSTDNSNLLFFVNDATSHSTYTVILSQDVNGPSGYFTTAAAQTPGATTGTLNTIHGDANFSYNFTGDTALQSFISSANTAGDVLQWGIIGGSYTGPSPTLREPVGNSLIVATSVDSASALTVANAGGVAGSAATGINTDVKNLNAKTFDAFNGTTQGIFGTTGSAGGTNLTLYGNGLNMKGTSIGSTYGLYGLTGNGTTSGVAIAFSLGSAVFNGTTLSFTGNTAVTPLPAAAWLFGSGLLGLLGIGRRRDRVVAAA